MLLIRSPTPAKLYSHLRGMTFTQLPLLSMAWQGPNHNSLNFRSLLDQRPTPGWPKTTSLVFFNHAIFNHLQP
jgi:hypothetical protein